MCGDLLIAQHIETMMSFVGLLYSITAFRQWMLSPLPTGSLEITKRLAILSQAFLRFLEQDYSLCCLRSWERCKPPPSPPRELRRSNKVKQKMQLIIYQFAAYEEGKTAKDQIWRKWRCIGCLGVTEEIKRGDFFPPNSDHHFNRMLSP